MYVNPPSLYLGLPSSLLPVQTPASQLDGESQELQRPVSRSLATHVNSGDLPARDSVHSTEGKPKSYAWGVPAPDHLNKLPPKNHTYITTRGTLRDPRKFEKIAQAEQAALARRAVQDLSDEAAGDNHNPLNFTDVPNAEPPLSPQPNRGEVTPERLYFDLDVAPEENFLTRN
jgi:hypothetical protein